MGRVYRFVAERIVVPSSTPERLYLMSPVDIYGITDRTCLSWPFFYDYQIETERFVAALERLCLEYPILCGRLRRHENTRYAIQTTPSGGGETGIPFTELVTDLTMAEAILDYGQTRHPTADFPVYPCDIPFFMDTLDIDRVLRGEAELLRVRLTRFRDGCSVTLTISHAMVDGERCIQLYGDLAKAYGGAKIPQRDFDRVKLWPDQLAQHYSSLRDDLRTMPRHATPNSEPFITQQYPNESCCTETLHFSNSFLKELKSSVLPFVPEGSFLSTNDVVFAFFWLLRCEIDSDETDHRGSPVPNVSNTVSEYVLELVHNGCEAVPSNYFGNAFVSLSIPAPDSRLDHSPLAEVIAKLAFALRGAITEFREDPSKTLESLLHYYSLVRAGNQFESPNRFVCFVSSLTKAPTQDADFGSGPPRMAYIDTPSPFTSKMAMVAPAPGEDNGLFVSFHLRQTQSVKLRNSPLLKNSNPGVKILNSQVTLAELEAMMKRSATHKADG